MRRVAVGVFGLGKEGRAFARRLSELPDAELRWAGDPALPGRRHLRPAWPLTRFARGFDDLLEDDELEAIVLATPAGEGRTQLARRALEAGKHVLVSEPLALRAGEAAALVRLAARVDRRLLACSPLLFEPAVRKLKELIELRRLGDIRYLRCEWRTPEGSHERASVIATIAASPVSLSLYLLGEAPADARTWGGAYAGGSPADVACCLLTFPTGVTARIHLSRLDPRPAASVSVVGSRRTAVFDTLDRERALTIYDRAIPPSGRWRDGDGIRRGDILTPRLAGADALVLTCDYLIAAVRSDAATGADVRRALAVTEILETLESELRAPAGPTIVEAEAASSQVIPLRARRRR